MSFSTNNRSTIDSEVYKWVVQQLKKKKVVTPNAIRQKAFEIGQEFDPNFKASINWYNNWKKRFDYNESPEAEALKHKKRSYTAAFKLHAVQRAMELESASQASLELDVSRRCLQRWKEELDVISSVAEHSSNAVYRRPGQGRKVRDTTLDTQLLEWVKDCWKQSISLSSGMIREKARELSPQPDFKASLGWFVKWQKRHCVDLKEQTCSPAAGETTTPLKLRLLPEGEVSAYSTPKKRRLSKKRTLSYDDTALLENDEEFDRLLLTWLVERWEAGDIVNDKMLKERAMELTANPDFKASKIWLQAWKGKYNVSLENQTYGTDGDEENEEIIEETQVYDEQVVIEGEQQPTQSSQEGQEGTSSEAPVTPTKEEAATALASLSADDQEIAEALQKLANAFGIAQGGGNSTKAAVSQLAALQQSDSPDFLLEGAGRVAVEEVVSEEVVTDEPMVVIEGTGSVAEASVPGGGEPSAVASTIRSDDITSSTVQSIVDVVSAATQIAQSITGSNNPSVTQPVAESLIQAVANQLSHSSTQSSSDMQQDKAEESKIGGNVPSQELPQNLTQTQVNLTQGNLAQGNFGQGNLSQENLTQGNLAQGNLTQGNLTQENLTQGNLTQGNLTQGNLGQGNLSQENLTQGNLAQGNLTQENLTKENLTQGNLAQGNLTQENLTQGNLTQGNIAQGNLTQEITQNLTQGNLTQESLTPELPQNLPEVSSSSLSLTTSDVVQTVQAGGGAGPVQFVTEEIIISEPTIVETSIASGGRGEPIFEAAVNEGEIGGQMEVVVQGGEGEVVESSQLLREDGDALVQLDIEDKNKGPTVSNDPMPPAHMISMTPTEVQVLTTGGNEIVMSTAADILTTASTVTLSGGEISIPQGSEDILDIVQERMVGGGGGGESHMEQPERDYDENFKSRVVQRASELGSVQQAAREFSVPWKIVASWTTQE